MLDTGRPLILSTHRLRIMHMRSVHESHVACLNHQHHMRYSEQRRISHTMTSQKLWLATASPDFWILDLQQKQPNMPVTVGSMTATFDRPNKLVDLGIMIVPACKDQGFGYEAMAAMTDYFLSEQGGMQKVEAGCHEHNVGMRKVLVKLMAYEGMRAAHFLNDNGTRSGSVAYGRRRPS